MEHLKSVLISKFEVIKRRNSLIISKHYFILHTLLARLLARSQYPEGPANGHLGTGFSWFSFVYKQMLRWFPRPEDATACFSCSPSDLNFLDPYFMFMLSLFHIYVHA
jgi:hypothetical protein